MPAAYRLGERFDLVVEGRWWLKWTTVRLGAARGGDSSNVVLPVGWTVLVGIGHRRYLLDRRVRDPHGDGAARTLRGCYVCQDLAHVVGLAAFLGSYVVLLRAGQVVLPMGGPVGSADQDNKADRTAARLGSRS
jgi:hypothetical protein